ncbi:MAG: prolipoprotein diacylglyceryl transferase [Thermoguttaceae bacterium]|nr:prolipoprotein diacylglyceryl transferase [Thermoguttaceae bacterium]
MRQTLFFIPTELFGVPLFGVGILFWLVVVYFLWRIVRNMLTERNTGELVSDILIGAVALAIVVWIAPSLNFGRGLPIRGYGVFLMLGIVVASLFTIHRAKKKWNIPPELIVSIILVEVVSGIIGARIFYVAEYWQSFVVHDPGRAVDLGATIRGILNLTQGGLVVFGSIIGGIVTTLVYLRIKKLPLLATMDIFSPALMIGIAIGRLGCFMNGCCFGAICDVTPPGVVFPVASPAHYYQMEHGQASLGGYNVFLPTETPDEQSETLFHLKKRDEGLMAASAEPVMVESVDADSAPEEAGLRPGMTILRVGALTPLKGEPTPDEVKKTAMVTPVGTRGFLEYLYNTGFPVRALYLVLDVTDPPGAEEENAQTDDKGESAGADAEKNAADNAPEKPDPPKPRRLVFRPGPFDVRAVHPTQLYSSALAFLLAAFLCFADRLVRKDGFVFALMLICYPVCRFLIEMVRTDEPSFMGTGLSVSQCVSLLTLLAGAALMIYSLSRHGAPAFEGMFPPVDDEAKS